MAAGQLTERLLALGRTAFSRHFMSPHPKGPNPISDGTFQGTGKGQHGARDRASMWLLCPNHPKAPHCTHTGEQGRPNMASKAQDRTLFVPGRSLGSAEWVWEAAGLAPTLASPEPCSSHFGPLGNVSNHSPASPGAARLQGLTSVNVLCKL